MSDLLLRTSSDYMIVGYEQQTDWPLLATHLHTCSGSCGCASTSCCGSVLPSRRAAVMLPPAPPMCTTRDAGISCAPAVGTRSLLLRRADVRKAASAELTARLDR